MSSRLPRDEALEKEDRKDKIKKIYIKHSPPIPHLLHAQQARALPYAKAVVHPSTGNYPAPSPDPTTHQFVFTFILFWTEIPECKHLRHLIWVYRLHCFPRSHLWGTMHKRVNSSMTVILSSKWLKHFQFGDIQFRQPVLKILRELVPPHTFYPVGNYERKLGTSAMYRNDTDRQV